MVEGTIQMASNSLVSPETDSDGLKDFRAGFEENMRSSKKPIRHESTAVLLLSYDSNDKAFTDLNVQDEVNELGEVFRNDYGFHVQQRIITSGRSAQIQMNYHLSAFAHDHGKVHGLLIVYYAGHGWHTIDRPRRDPRGFDLYPRKLQYQERPAGDEVVMWELSESVLHHVEGDVLVIFDCCDAAALAKLRSATRVFEYLGAGHKYTHGEGKHTFTSALTWALKEMASESPFTTDRLVAKIKDHEDFPPNQEPVLFPRRDFLPEHIWLASMPMLASPSHLDRRRSSTTAEFRDENCDFADFRVTFNRPLGDGDGKAVAELMAPVVRTNNLRLSARHVAFLGKGPCKPAASRARWTRVRHHMSAARRFQASLSSSGTTSTLKRKRLSFEEDEEGPIRTKYAKPPTVWNLDQTTQIPPSSSNEDHDTSSGETLSLRLDTGIIPSTVMSESPNELETDTALRASALLTELAKNDQHDPAFFDFLQSQIEFYLDRGGRGPMSRS